MKAKIVTVLYRGKQKARLTPIGGDKKGSLGFHPAFGGGKAGPI